MSLSVRWTFVMLGGLAILSLSAASPIAAQTNAECSFDPLGPSASRTVTLDVTRSGFGFRSEASDGSGVLSGSFDTGAAHLFLEYHRSGSASPTRLLLGFVSVVEFRDLDGDGRFGFADESVRELALGQRAGATVQEIPQLAPGVRVVVAQYPLNVTAMFPGSVAIRFTFVEETRLVDGYEQSPERIRADVSVDGFQFARNDTRLALRNRQQGGPNMSASADEVLVGDGNAALSYRWSRCALNGSSLSIVGPAVIEYPSGALPRTSTVFAYADGDRIEHPSSIGLGFVPNDAGAEILESLLPNGNVLVFGVAALGATVAIVGTAWRRLRGA